MPLTKNNRSEGHSTVDVSAAATPTDSDGPAISRNFRRRRRKRQHEPAMRSPLPLVFLLVLFSATASSFQVSAGRATNHGSSESRTTRLAVSSIAPPAHHLDWLRAQEDSKSEKKHGSSQPSTIAGKNLEWINSTADDAEIPLEQLAAFNSTSAKEAWAARYTTVEALRQAFGRNRNVLWGDLNAVTTRRLYKTLLPRALLELYHCHGGSSEDLAPLAYRARVAAKMYARERSTLPARMGACLYDGARQFRKYGSFQMSGMSYPQIWDKYARQVMQEEDWENEEDLTSKICYKILQKSCETNPTVDALLLKEDAMDLQEITRKLEKEVFDLIQDDEAAKQWSIQRYKTLKTLLRIKRRLEQVRHPDDTKQQTHESSKTETAPSSDDNL